MENNFKMIAKTMYGFEPVLAKELMALGAMDVKEGTRNVSFVGDTGFMYKANLCLRTAIKILKPYQSFKIFSEDDLYKQIYDLPWENFMDVNDTLAIDATVHSDTFTHSKYISLKTKDAIVDRFRDKFGKRPDVDLDFPTLRLNIHIEKNFCNVSFDSSGQSLHKRGYKTATNIAPINEVLAAGMLLLSSWDGQCDFMDPMCGSGTILIEAAMIACNIPPNLNRKEFAFERWKDWDEDLFEKIEASVLKKMREFHFKITGYDTSPSAVHKAIDNIENANLSEFIKVERQDFFASQKEGERHLHMLFNPPYGERLEIDMPKFYKEIGDTLKQSYPGTDAWFITSNLEAIKHVGLRPSRKIKLYNGALESKLLKYQIYQGSKKAKFQD
ncbi:THUMP domain-containing class I SAM-dependent RNA methyltransferase [Salegentibacter mishustinae]|uniref:DNA methylase n=1 Tax=Salegentibacter mishustinae TaxID=270918 RepID=A0A0Q9ZI28_9FLAO|nr:THUMP domain-containing protein [Salegentibacter mishustinae]KRG29730.1 DNA methylase [Salegentibacter mishustinae]PNW21176.1 DNA methylase [Salegentibacter mishustinae]PZX60944.1 putative N6-adenine-specific DNA methylase [Salegentibacter mishustinae]GGW99836.1 RNA methyltransferase [Salegentibacter mishustinae]